MKRIWLVLCTCLVALMPLSVSAQEVVKASVKAGETKGEWIVEITMDNAQKYVAMQVDMELPDSTKAQSVQKSDRMKNETVLSNRMKNGLLRILAYNLGRKPILGNSGVLFTIKVQSSVWPKKKKFHLHNIHLTSLDSKDVALPDVEFKR